MRSTWPAPVCAQISYLIAVHDRPEQFARLLWALNCDEVEFIVHVDAKADEQPFRQAARRFANVRFTSKRHDVWWKGYGVVAGTTELLAEAVKTPSRYKVLLSGVDYPVRSNDEILEFFGSANRQYLHYFQLEDFPRWLSKVENYALSDYPWANPRSGSRRPYRLYKRFIADRILRRLPKRKFLEGMTPWGGSGWWAFTHECAEYCVNYLSENPKFRRFYKYTDAPDEMVFQTIVMNSPFKSSVVMWDEYSRDRQGVVENKLSKPLAFTAYNNRYIDWYTPELGFPSTLTEANFDEIAASEALFARKFDGEISATLLERIDAELRSRAKANYVHVEEVEIEEVEAVPVDAAGTAPVVVRESA